jgi:glucan phosphoethanolaminetransferase (alkaline phosphatase superfamily)
VNFKANWRTIFLWTTWILLVTSPNLLRHFWDPNHRNIFALNLFVIGYTFCIHLLFLSGLLGLRAAVVVMSVLACLNPFEFMHSYFLHSQFNEGTLGLIFSLDHTKAKEFSLGINYFLLFGFLIPVLIWKIFGLLRFPTFTFKQRGIFLAISLLLYTYPNLDRLFPGKFKAYIPRKNAIRVKASPPFNIPYSFSKYLYRQYHRSSDLKLRSTFKFHPESTANKEAELIVLVVGESSRAHNWSLFGYDRSTTPLLEKRRQNLVLCPDYIAPGNNTRNSFPQLITRATVNQFNRALRERSILSLFKEAGFQTWILSNQGLMAEDYSFFAEDADSLVHFPVYKHPDEVLLQPFREALERNKDQKQFILIHTIGSHFAYYQRYPPSFKFFKPGMEDKPFVYIKGHRFQLVNSYDNSIRYTDFILDQIIQTLEADGRKAKLFYIADHGEVIFDDPYGTIYHSSEHPTELEVHVPFLAWFSSKALEEEQTLTFRKNALNKLGGEVVFYTLAGSAGLNFPLNNEKLNLFSKEFKSPSHRFVLTPSHQIFTYD